MKSTPVAANRFRTPFDRVRSCLEEVFGVCVCEMPPFEVCAPQNVKVEVFDLLPAVVTDIGDDAIAFFLLE